MYITGTRTGVIAAARQLGQDYAHRMLELGNGAPASPADLPVRLLAGHMGWVAGTIARAFFLARDEEMPGQDVRRAFARAFVEAAYDALSTLALSAEMTW